MPYRRYCIEHIDKIFPISQDACEFLTKKYGYKDKYILSRLGVQKRNVTTKASAPFNFQVLTISQLIQRKRIDLVLNALTVFASRNQDISIQWTHFGTGNMAGNPNDFGNSSQDDFGSANDNAEENNNFDFGGDSSDNGFGGFI